MDVAGSVDASGGGGGGNMDWANYWLTSGSEGGGVG